MGFLDKLSEDIQERYKETRQHAEREYARKVETADRAGKNAVWFGLELDLRNPWDREAALAPHKKQAAMEFLGELLFFVIDAYFSVPFAAEERLADINKYLTIFRVIIVDRKWPGMRVERKMWRARLEQEVDRALIPWLEGREEWKKFEAQILPELETLEIVHPSDHEPPNPLSYFEHWALATLPIQARQQVRAGLLAIHGEVLDGKLSGEVESWRRAYDVVAESFQSVRLLSEEILTVRIPRMVADASAAGAWAAEPFGRTGPTAIFSVLCGSRFYPLWRVLSLMQALQGRISYWRGRQLLNEEPDSSVSPDPLLPAGTEVSAKALKLHRHAIVDTFKKKNELESMDAVARRLGVSETALQGIIRGDTSRYSPEKLDLVLSKMGCTRADWDNPAATAQTEIS
jgi:hypothetical protein